MKPIFETSARTRAQIDFFRSLKLSEKVSYRAASAALKFDVTAASSASARKIAERDHEVFIAIIPQYGFFHGTHEDMVKSLPAFFMKVRRISKRICARAGLSLKGNLSEHDYRAASEMFSRARIIHSTSEKTKVMSNRIVREGPPLSKEKSGYANIERIHK